MKIPAASQVIETTFEFTIEELATALEAIFQKQRRWLKRSQRVIEFVEVVSTLEKFQQKSIRQQAALLQVLVDGGTFVLDARCEIADIHPSDIRACPSRISVHTRTFQSRADQTFHWLLREYNLVRADDHIFHFGLDGEGLIHCSRHFLTYLMVPTRAALQEGENSTGEATETDDTLITAKIALDAEGLEILRREASNLRHLQMTGKVVELWNLDQLEEQVDHGALLTLYYHSPLESELNMWMSKLDVEMLAVELLSALDCLHRHGWIWNGVRTGHYLFNLFRRDHRDDPRPLKALGLENAEFVEKNSSAETGTRAWCKGDLNSLGHLLMSLCSREPGFKGTNVPDGLSLQDKERIITAHNRLVRDGSKLLQPTDWIITLIDKLLRTGPTQWPSASEALHYAKAQMHVKESKELIMGEIFLKVIPGYLDANTGRFIWPATLHCEVVQDIHHRCATPRLTTAVTVKACFRMPYRAVIAKYGGRPTHKRFLRWLQLQGLHTHAISDGAEGAFDGRREANGIFDLAYYEGMKQVQ